jgi:hypothetical protein
MSTPTSAIIKSYVLPLLLYNDINQTTCKYPMRACILLQTKDQIIIFWARAYFFN